MEKDGLWSKVVESIHRQRSGWELVPINKKYTGVWKNIVKLVNKLKLEVSDVEMAEWESCIRVINAASWKGGSDSWVWLGDSNGSFSISEYDVIEILENVCNLKKHEADWILKIDIVEQGDRLELVEQEYEGQCGSECKTIERACQGVIGYYDTDVAEYIYKLQKGREPGETLVPKSAKEAGMEKMLKSMEGMPGAPGMKMYSREELMRGKGLDDEDDDDEPSIPSI
ncbi:uncharacterized protein LOC143622040 [Bidens hawaiensis]|uniref:uncharacterized protein LOC143622040 n=1 Tax=Bidens hawaiensis TaxID=980011 RepID=UPI004049AE4E